VLRAVLWGLTRDLKRATRWASRTGQAFAFLLIAVGAAMAFGIHVPFFGTGFVGGIWLAFIGWFLNTAAVMAYRQVLMRELLQNVPVERLMRRELPPAIRASTPVSGLVNDFVMPTGEQTFPVVDGSSVVGIVRARDVRKVRRDAWDDTLVSAIMTPLAKVATTTPNADAHDAIRSLAENIDELVVTDGGEVVGILRREDVARWLSLQAENQGRQPPLGGRWAER
jgi:predicted transcriptional regulator